jgi:hypothetical protein
MHRPERSKDTTSLAFPDRNREFRAYASHIAQTHSYLHENTSGTFTPLEQSVTSSIEKR